MPERRVAITGLGAVTAAGVGMGALWDALLEARPCVRRIGGFDASRFPCQVAGELEADFSARASVPKDYRKAVKVMARDIEIAVVAADLAFRDAGIATAGIGGDGATVPSGRLGCNVGAGLICSDLNELGAAVNSAVTDGRFDMRKWGSSGMNNLTPLWLLKYLPNMLACHVTIIHQAKGPSNTITCGDASGHLTVGEATRLVARGDADVVIAGGAESKLNPMGLLRQGLLGRLCTSCNESPGLSCRPFDTQACGTVIGEGGGLVVLEALDYAQARGARIYAEVAGFGAACSPDGLDVLKPTDGGLDLAVSKALADAGLEPQDVDALIAHGTAVPGEDRCEAEAWRRALGPVAQEVPATAVTGAIGSLFAGAGGVELAVAALALHTGTVPPTVNFEAHAAGNRLNLADQVRSAELRVVASAAFSIGGQSGACVLKRYEP